MGKTSIEYADFVWNVTAGCEKVSPGCEHCYAERMAWRLCCSAGPLVYHHNPSPLRAYKRVVTNARWNGNVATIPERLDDPLHWRKPRIVAVNLMADLFHPKVPARFILDVWRIMERCPQHVFLLLTKRAKRMDALLNSWPPAGHLFPPLSNVWPGVTICNQAEADRDLPYLLRCPAAHRWVSIEPSLGAIPRLPLDGISWAVLGGETGPGARPCLAEWALSIRDQCHASGVPFWLKQIDRFDGRPLPKEMPPELMALRKGKP